MHKYHPFGKLNFEEVACGFSPRKEQNMSLCWGLTRKAIHNRKKFLSALGIDHRDLVAAKQVHSNNVRCIRQEDKGRGAFSYETALPDTDALITAERQLALAIFTADCPPIFLYDPKKRNVGLVHAGWRSSKENIIARALQMMKGELKSPIEDIYIGFGPAIRECCYEVGEDFHSFFPGEILKKEERNYLDLVRINRMQALEAGADINKIFDPGICTSCRNQEFYSFRREGPGCGRTISVIMLK